MSSPTKRAVGEMTEDEIVDFVKKWETAESLELAASAVGMDARDASRAASAIRKRYVIPLRKFPSGRASTAARAVAASSRERIRDTLLNIITEAQRPRMRTQKGSK